MSCFLPAGSTVRIRVANRYNTYDFGGSKSVILTTNSWVGGRNNFLGALWITIGGLSLLVALAFFLAYNAGVLQRLLCLVPAVECSVAGSRNRWLLGEVLRVAGGTARVNR